MINFNGVEWKVFLASPNHPELMRESNGEQALGCCNNNTKCIYINEMVSDDYLKKILCHELTHAAMFSYDIELNEDQEEIVANLIATYGQEIIHMANVIFRRIKNQE